MRTAWLVVVNAISRHCIILPETEAAFCDQHSSIYLFRNACGFLLACNYRLGTDVILQHPTGTLCMHHTGRLPEQLYVLAGAYSYAQLMHSE